jgi:hypothetical protein
MTTYVAVFALILGYVALIAAYLALRTLAKVRRATTVLARGARTANGKESLIEATARYAEQSALLAEQLTELRTHVDTTCAQTLASVQAGTVEISDVVRNIALVRYDAFPDLSGRMSFSLALLNEHGDGVTISAIVGSTDSSVYAKAIADGKGEHPLSPEEKQAVQTALRKNHSGLLSRRAG